MKKELALSICIMATLLVLFVAGIESSTFAVHVLCMGSVVALFFYHLNRRNQGFTFDTALAQKSLTLGVVASVPVATHVLPLL